MVGPFSLRVSAEPVTVALAVDVARRYVELAGGPSTAAQAFATAVGSVLDEVADGGEGLELAFTAVDGVVEAVVTCGNRRDVCRVRTA